MPTAHGLAAGQLVAVTTALNAAARAAPNIFGQVAWRGGAVPRADVIVGALLPNVLA